jgi:3-oxoacyl-[acyl-carrier-protein] synthase-1
MGIASPVGLDATTTCASIRAGITRTEPIPGFQVLRIDDHENVPLRGHAVPLAADGFVAPGRWMPLARLAVRDLTTQPGVPSLDDLGFWSSVVIVFVTPDVETGRFFGHLRLDGESLHKTFVKPLMRSLQLAGDQTYLIDQGRVGVFRAIASADLVLSKHGSTTMLILAVDSYLDGFTLDWLAIQRRLKSDANPVGLTPGEAAVALLLRTSESEPLPGAMPRIGVTGCAVGVEVRSPSVPSAGAALGAVMTDALERAALNTPFRGDLFTDLNGEPWRAQEFGGAQVQVSRQLLGEVRTQVCAVSVGDTGAASGAFNIALAARALERNYALGSSALVVSSSYDGDVAAAVLQREG